jgi:hypothetical protein
LKRYESRYCTFAVPDAWAASPPFGYAEPGEDVGRMSAQALERWLAEPVAAAAYAGKHKQILPALRPGYELVTEGKHATAGPGDAYALTYRFRDEEGDPALARTILLAHGPLLCELTLAGPDGENRERDRLFGAIAATFTLRGMEFMSKLKDGPLLGGARPGAAASEPAAPRTPFPQTCVTLPIPPGWEAADEDGDAVFRRGGSEIRLHRVLGSDGGVEAWFKRRMRQLQATGSFLLGCERGELGRRDYAALLFDEQGQGRTWNSAAVKRTLELFVRDRQPLLWSLRAHESVLEDQRQVLESLVAAVEFLPPAEWRTKLAEPWIDYTLEGPWQSPDPGLYVDLSKPPSFIHLAREKSALPLAALRPAVVESLRKGAALKEITAQEDALGSWRGYEALRYSLDGVAKDATTMSVRAAWVATERGLHSLFLKGAHPAPVDSLFAEMLEALRPTR